MLLPDDKEPADPDEETAEGDPAETHTGRMRVHKREPGSYWNYVDGKRELPATPPVEPDLAP